MDRCIQIHAGRGTHSNQAPWRHRYNLPTQFQSIYFKSKHWQSPQNAPLKYCDDSPSQTSNSGWWANATIRSPVFIVGLIKNGWRSRLYGGENRTEEKRNESNGGGYMVVGNSTAFYKIWYLTCNIWVVSIFHQIEAKASSDELERWSLQLPAF